MAAYEAALYDIATIAEEVASECSRSGDAHGVQSWLSFAEKLRTQAESEE